LPYGNSVLIIYRSDVGKLQENISESETIGNGNVFIPFKNGGIIAVHSKMGEEDIKFREQDFNHLQT